MRFPLMDPEPDAGGGGGNDFSELISDSPGRGAPDDAVSTEPEPAPPVSAPVPAPAPEVPVAPAAAPAVAPVTEAAPVAPAPVAPTAPVAPAAPIETQEQAAARIATARREAEDEIASKITFTPEEVAQLQLNPEQVLPRLAARVQIDAFQSTFAAVTSILPNVVRSIIASAQAEKANEDEFYGLFPGLKPHNEVVVRAAQMYRTANPQMKGIPTETKARERFFREIGAMAHMMAGLPVGQQAPVAPPPPSRPPFVPAAPGASASGAAPAAPTNAFADFVGEIAVARQQGRI